MVNREKLALDDKLAKWAGFTPTFTESDDKEPIGWLEPGEVLPEGRTFTIAPTPYFCRSLDDCFKWAGAETTSRSLAGQGSMGSALSGH
jgi:hypothetical protein